MKNYKEYNKINLGMSDIALLTLRYCDNKGKIKYFNLTFGKDGVYNAYLIDSNCEIPFYYKKVFDKRIIWCQFIDDQKVSFECRNKNIKIYRSANMGCIVQLL